jgi:hypothetical protein
MKRLRLVQLPVPPPAALAATGNVPLAAGCLAVSARVHGLTSRLDVEVVSPDVTDLAGDAALADRLAADEPDFLGLSLYLWNVERSLHLAREVKRRSPRTRVLVGGPEVSPDNPFVLGLEGYDVAVTGEAEDTFAEVMGRLLDGREVAGVPGVAVRTPAGLGPFAPPPKANFPLTRYPSPFTQGLVPVDPRRSTYVETVRGCRSSCTFCFYPRSSAVLRALDVEQSARLVASVRDAGAKEVVFLDPTFNHRPDFDALLDALIEVNASRGLTFFAEVRPEGLKVEHAKKLGRAGFTQLELGLQSVNPKTLKRVKRGGNPAKVAEAARMLHGEGIELLVDLIVGLPGDTRDDVLRGIDFLYENGLASEAQVFGLFLLPGTEMRATAPADGVLFDPAPPYRVLQTATMSQDELRATLREAERRLGRRLDEVPRPHLVERAADAAMPDVLHLDADAPVPPQRPGAQHLALWFEARDPFAAREVMARVIDARLALDPYAMLDVVVVAREEFPLDLLAVLRRALDRGTPSYASRALALRGENLQRRVVVVVPKGAQLEREWLEAASEQVPVYRDLSAKQALAALEEDEGPSTRARIVGPVTPAQWAALVKAAEVEDVSFADRELEARWLQAALG